jgi:hypothetical protein
MLVSNMIFIPAMLDVDNQKTAKRCSGVRTWR